MSPELKELRNLLDVAKDIRGGAPDRVFDSTDPSFPKEKRVLHAFNLLDVLRHRPSFTMTMHDAYSLGATIAFLNLEIERLEALYEEQAKP